MQICGTGRREGARSSYKTPYSQPSSAKHDSSEHHKKQYNLDTITHLTNPIIILRTQPVYSNWCIIANMIRNIFTFIFVVAAATGQFTQSTLVWLTDISTLILIFSWQAFLLPKSSAALQD